MGNTSTWCIPSGQKRQTVYFYQSLSGEELNHDDDHSAISSSKVSLRNNKNYPQTHKTKLSRRQPYPDSNTRRGNKQNVNDLHEKIDQLNSKLNSMKKELANQLVRKLKDTGEQWEEERYGGRSVAISRYANQGGVGSKTTGVTAASKASRFGVSKHWEANSIYNREMM